MTGRPRLEMRSTCTLYLAGKFIAFSRIDMTQNTTSRFAHIGCQLPVSAFWLFLHAKFIQGETTNDTRGIGCQDPPITRDAEIEIQVQKVNLFLSTYVDHPCYLYMTTLILNSLPMMVLIEINCLLQERIGRFIPEDIWEPKGRDQTRKKGKWIIIIITV